VRSVLVATAFLTRVPVPIEATGADVRASTQWFPLIGAALGAGAAVLSLALASMGVPPQLAATLIVAAVAWVTGAIHLDGLADAADGFGGGRTKEDVLRIMRDPRVGSFGAIALIVVIAVKIAALSVLIERRADVATLIVVPALSRWAIVALGTWLPYAREDGGLGDAATQRGQTGSFAVATAIAIPASVAAAGAAALSLWVGVASVTALIARSASRKVGGVTGDVFGATVELSEASGLVVAVLVSAIA
jgi:adenosylcobinamide-GDP ribazoletransferase